MQEAPSPLYVTREIRYQTVAAPPWLAQDPPVPASFGAGNFTALISNVRRFGTKVSEPSLEVIATPAALGTFGAGNFTALIIDRRRFGTKVSTIALTSGSGIDPATSLGWQPKRAILYGNLYYPASRVSFGSAVVEPLVTISGIPQAFTKKIQRTFSFRYTRIAAPLLDGAGASQGTFTPTVFVRRFLRRPWFHRTRVVAPFAAGTGEVEVFLNPQASTFWFDRRRVVLHTGIAKVLFFPTVPSPVGEWVPTAVTARLRMRRVLRKSVVAPPASWKRRCLIATLDIWNSALQELGVAPLSSETENSRNRVLVEAAWPVVRRRLLADHFFNSSMVPAEQLSPITPAPSVGAWRYHFLLPECCIRVKSLNELPNQPGVEQWEVAQAPSNMDGRVLLTNTATAVIRYVKDMHDPSHMEPCLVEAMVLALALKLAGSFPRSASKLVELRARAKEAIEIAKSVDSHEQDPPFNQNSGIIDARGGW